MSPTRADRRRALRRTARWGWDRPRPPRRGEPKRRGESKVGGEIGVGRHAPLIRPRQTGVTTVSRQMDAVQQTRRGRTPRAVRRQAKPEPTHATGGYRLDGGFGQAAESILQRPQSLRARDVQHDDATCDAGADSNGGVRVLDPPHGHGAEIRSGAPLPTPPRLSVPANDRKRLETPLHRSGRVQQGGGDRIGGRRVKVGRHHRKGRRGGQAVEGHHQSCAQASVRRGGVTLLGSTTGDDGRTGRGRCVGGNRRSRAGRRGSGWQACVMRRLPRKTRRPDARRRPSGSRRPRTRPARQRWA